MEEMLPCPKCGENKLHPERVRNSLSRDGSGTYICNWCGMEEAGLPRELQDDIEEYAAKHGRR